jgi:hypothetical protein
MINQRREPVIMDFGLARRIDKEEARLTKSGSVLGTPAYMPPEQVRGDVQAIGPASDVYSLGVILYELLTGRLPFDGPVFKVLAQIATREPEPPSKHRADLDPQLEAICLKAMAKNVGGRYASMKEMAAALTEYLKGDSKAGIPASSRAAAVLQTEGESLADQLFGDRVMPQDTLRPGAQSGDRGARPSRRTPRWPWITAGGAAAACFLAGIVILIRHPDGSTTRIEAPPNSKGEIENDGKTIRFSGPDQATTPVSPQPQPAKTKNGAALGEFDYYARGLSGVWQPMMDSRGQVMTGGDPCLSSDGLELVFWKRHAEERGGRDLYLARRSSILQPFGEAVHQLEASTAGFEGVPSFAHNDLVLYFISYQPNPKEKDIPGTIMSATRPNRGQDFGVSRVLPEFPKVRGGATRYSPDGRISFGLKMMPTDVLYRASRRPDGKSFDFEPTNLPGIKLRVHSEPWPVAVSNAGALIFTQHADGKLWLSSSQTRGGALNYEKPSRLLDLGIPQHRHSYPCTISQDGRLLIGWLNGELLAMRLPEGVREKVKRVLDR